MGIPLIDLSQASAAQTARRIDEALCGAVFFAVVGHGVPGCVASDRPARHGPITAGEHLAEMYRRTTVAS